MNNGIRFYEIAIHKFLGNSIIKRLEGINFQSNEEIRQRLKPDTEIGIGEWVDVSGLIAPKSEINYGNNTSVFKYQPMFERGKIQLSIICLQKTMCQ